MLSIEKVPVCLCVQVTGLNRDNTTEDAVLYYFENPKNGGGDVNNVELNIKEGWALVYFEDPLGIRLVENVPTIMAICITFAIASTKIADYLRWLRCYFGCTRL